MKTCWTLVIALAVAACDAPPADNSVSDGPQALSRLTTKTVKLGAVASKAQVVTKQAASGPTTTGKATETNAAVTEAAATETRLETVASTNLGTPLSGLERTRVTPPASDDLGKTLRIPAPERVIKVKFRDGLRVRLRPEVPRDPDSRLLPVDLDGQVLVSDEAREVLKTLDEATWARTHRPTEKQLDAMRARTEAFWKTSVPDLNLYFSLRLPKDVSATAAATLLEKLPEVERAAPMRDYFLADAPDYTEPQGQSEPVPGVIYEHPYQRYLQAAPLGVDAEYAWQFEGGDGAGVNVVVIESAFFRNHPDLPYIEEDGTPYSLDDVQERHINHGTATFGVIVGRDNGYGVKGIAHAATPFFFSQFGMRSQDSAGIEPSITWAYDLDSNVVGQVAQVQQPGDVMVLEVQVKGPNRPENPPDNDHSGLVPAEWDLDVFHAIRHAVAHGYVVVEAAGNGAEDLDAAVYRNDPDAPHRPFAIDGDTRINDSGAIIVGAGNSNWQHLTNAGFLPRERVQTSNYGRRVDVQAWGNWITTTGPGKLDSATIHAGPDGRYRSDYGGTSGATAILGGVASSLQGYVKAAGLDFAYLSSKQMRAILIETGQAQQTDGAELEHIGPMPDLRAAIDSLDAGDVDPVIETWDSHCSTNVGEASLAAPEFNVQVGPDAGTGEVRVELRFGQGVYVEGSSIYYTTDGSEPNTLCPNAIWAPLDDTGGSCAATQAWEHEHTLGDYSVVIPTSQLPATLRAVTAIQYCWNAPGQHLASPIAELTLAAP